MVGAISRTLRESFGSKETIVKAAASTEGEACSAESCTRRGNRSARRLVRVVGMGLLHVPMCRGVLVGHHLRPRLLLKYGECMREIVVMTDIRRRRLPEYQPTFTGESCSRAAAPHA